MVKKLVSYFNILHTAPFPFRSCPKAEKDGVYNSQKNNKL